MSEFTTAMRLGAFALIVLIGGCQAPDPEAENRELYGFALAAYNQSDYPRALAGWTEAAERGDVRSMVKLAELYGSPGQGVMQDEALAKEWLERAAIAGHAPAQVQLAENLLFGDGSSEDVPAALEWLKLAAAQGDAAAQGTLALLLSDDPTAPYHDPDQALSWATQGAAGGDPDATHVLADMHLTGVGVEANPQEGVRLHRHAADLGNLESQYLTGSFYASGEHIGRDLEVAHRYLQSAARSGHEPAREPLQEVENELFLGAEDIEVMEDVWHDNKLRFEREYVGRTFRDRMPFFEVGEAFLQDGVYSVQFGDNMMFGDIKCYVRSASVLERISYWEKGRSVVVTGVVAENEGFSFRLDGCRFED